MRRKSLHILVLAWQCLWLLVMVPGHTRGQITLPDFGEAAQADVGEAPQLRAVLGCCSTGGDDAPTGEERTGSCAVCHFATRMSTAVTLDFVLSPPRVLAERALPSPRAVQVQAHVRVPEARGPPAAEFTVV